MSTSDFQKKKLTRNILFTAIACGIGSLIPICIVRSCSVAPEPIKQVVLSVSEPEPCVKTEVEPVSVPKTVGGETQFAENLNKAVGVLLSAEDGSLTIRAGKAILIYNYDTSNEYYLKGFYPGDKIPFTYTGSGDDIQIDSVWKMSETKVLEEFSK